MKHMIAAFAGITAWAIWYSFPENLAAYLAVSIIMFWLGVVSTEADHTNEDH